MLKVKVKITATEGSPDGRSSKRTWESIVEVDPEKEAQRIFNNSESVQVCGCRILKTEIVK